MPSLNVTSLNDTPQDTLPNTDDAVFKDMSLPFSLDSTGGNKALFGSTIKKDMQVDLDYKAISNSLVNIFNTSPGQKILNPRFGVNLQKYLFETVTEEIAGVIGDVILQGIEAYEPRVSVTGIDVIADPDQSMYDISIYLNIIALQSQHTWTGTLTDEGLSGGNTSNY